MSGKVGGECRVLTPLRGTCGTSILFTSYIRFSGLLSGKESRGDSFRQAREGEPQPPMLDAQQRIDPLGRVERGRRTDDNQAAIIAPDSVLN